MKTLQELEDEQIHQLEQFTVLTWQPQPQKGRVRVWVDDGAFKLSLSNEKFVSVITQLLMDSQSKQTYYNLKNIENSLGEYQGFYQYNRATDTFKALHQIRDLDTLDRHELYQEARADFMKKRHDGILTSETVFSAADADRKAVQVKSGALSAMKRFYGVGGW